MVLSIAMVLVGSAAAQPALVAYPNPWDGLEHDTITVRNAGVSAVPLDSVRFASSVLETQTWGWYFHLRGWFVDGFRAGWVVCDPGTNFQCAADYYGEMLAPGDSLRIEQPRTYCAICRNRPIVEQVGLFDDTLRVHAGDQTLEVVILNGQAIPGVEDAVNRRRAALEVYPNPTRGPATLRITTAGTGEFGVRVLDVTGRLIRRASYFAPAAGATELALALGGLPSGVYHVAVQGPAGPVAGARVVVRR
jgi:hypothetical protein